jgi:cell division protein FtsB
MLKNAFILFVVAFVVLWIFLPVFSRVQDVRQKDLDYKQQIADLEQENKKLLAEMKLLDEDPEYLEKVAREKMGLIRQGEMVYKLRPGNAVE